MQLKSNSAVLERLALPTLPQLRPLAPPATSPARPETALLRNVAMLRQGNEWEAAAWVLLSVSTLFAIGFCFLG